MNPALETLARIAEVEFSQIVVDSAVIGEKLRLFLSDSSIIDVWVSRVLEGRFGFHWEKFHRTGGAEILFLSNFCTSRVGPRWCRCPSTDGRGPG
jgi:hypothetical protein